MKLGFNINHPKKNGITPLGIAAYEGHLNVVKYLVSKGADTYPKQNYAISPVNLACRQGNNQIVKFLLKYKKVSDSVRNEKGAVLRAVKTNNIELLEALFENEIELDVEDSNGEHVLMIATKNNYSDIVRMLCRNSESISSKINLEDKKTNLTPFMHAILNGNFKMADLLLARGADKNYVNSKVLTIAQLCSLRPEKYFKSIEYLQNLDREKNKPENKLPKNRQSSFEVHKVEPRTSIIEIEKNQKPESQVKKKRIKKKAKNIGIEDEVEVEVEVEDRGSEIGEKEEKKESTKAEEKQITLNELPPTPEVPKPKKKQKKEILSDFTLPKIEDRSRSKSKHLTSQKSIKTKEVGEKEEANYPSEVSYRTLDQRTKSSQSGGLNLQQNDHSHFTLSPQHSVHKLSTTKSSRAHIRSSHLQIKKPKPKKPPSNRPKILTTSDVNMARYKEKEANYLYDCDLPNNKKSIWEEAGDENDQERLGESPMQFKSKSSFDVMNQRFHSEQSHSLPPILKKQPYASVRNVKAFSDVRRNKFFAPSIEEDDEYYDDDDERMFAELSKKMSQIKHFHTKIGTSKHNHTGYNTKTISSNLKLSGHPRKKFLSGY
jgi:ankyrin repeat protein